MPDFDKKFVVISIHAPRTGSDDGTDKRLMDELISIHAPRTGSDGRASKGARFSLQNFNPRSPHGERPGRMPESTPARDFNPRSPHGERPASMRYTGIRGRISIHAPRTGSDCPALRDNRVVSDFNPRSPHGERPRGTFTSDFFIKFQSTLPARGATQPHGADAPKFGISIHAPRTGSDQVKAFNIALALFDFNPRSPHGERLSQDTSSHAPPLFQSTLPARGATFARFLH